MQSDQGTLTIHSRSCAVTHAALVLIPPSDGCDIFCLYLHVDALTTGGGFFMLDHLPVKNVVDLSALQTACICFTGDVADADDTVGSEPIDLVTSGWTFPGFELDETKSWRVESLRADFEGVDASSFRVKVRCQLRNWLSNKRAVGEADFVVLGTIGSAPLYDEATGTWQATED
jgi:hypothetical protein